MKKLTIDNREYSYQTSISNELAIDTTQSYLCELDQFTCLSVIGEQAEKLLQGQFSCDVSQADDKNFISGALCNLQGRVKLLADIVRCHDYQLILPKDMLDIGLRDLKTAAMLSRVKLHPSAHYSVFAIAGNISHAFIPKSYRLPADQTLKVDAHTCVYKVCDSILMILVHNKDSEALRAHYANVDRLRGSLLFHHLALQHKRISIYPTSSAHFLPHKISLQDLGYLDFEKGCYKGQEIIARMHYRGKLKHRLELFECETRQSLIPGQSLHNDKGDTIGDIVDYCPLTETRYLIAGSVLIQHEGTILCA